MRCPNCHTSNLGIIGEERYYCWNCLVEVTQEHPSRESVNAIQQPEQYLEDLFTDEG